MALPPGRARSVPRAPRVAAFRAALQPHREAAPLARPDDGADGGGQGEEVQRRASRRSRQHRQLCSRFRQVIYLLTFHKVGAKEIPYFLRNRN